MKRQIVLDTETTGLRPDDGHRLVEVGAVEIIDGKLTGRHFHSLINPERDIPEEVVKIHGITNEKVLHAPKFRDVADKFLKFIEDSEVFIHNADFDTKFLNAELQAIDKGKVWDYVKNIHCTIKISKRIFAEEKKHNLDHLCKKLGVDNSGREFHGALLDSQLLAEVFLKMRELHPEEDMISDMEQTNWIRRPIKRFSGIIVPAASLSAQEITEHDNFLQELAKKSKVTPIFLKTSTMKP